MKSILIVPDVHGRVFWREALEMYPDEEVVFLGDYLDPYPEEGITPGKSILVLHEILDLPEDRVTLLLGNHDLGYLDSVHRQSICRHDWRRDQEIEAIFRKNLERFKIGLVRDDVIFSHAGIHPEWSLRHPEFGKDPKEIMRYLEDNLWERNVLDALSEYSRYRGGYWYDVGSPVWSDIREWITPREDDGILQVVGHTQLQGGKIIELPGVTCIDCKHVCRLINNKIEVL